MTIGTSGWTNPSGNQGLGLTVIANELKVNLTAPISLNYLYKLTINNIYMVKPYKYSKFKGFSINDFLTNNSNFNLSGTNNITWGGTACLSGDALANNTVANSFNFRTAWGTTRPIVGYTSMLIYANPGNNITFSGRFGQPYYISNYKYSCWYNIGNGWVLINTTTATGGNGGTVISTFNLPAAINTSMICALATTLSISSLSSLNTLTIYSASIYLISVDIYLLKIL